MPSKSNINLVITDLDDTVWDWFYMWSNSFIPYYDSIKNLTGLSDEELKSDFKQLHKKYHTSEVSFAYKELKSLTAGHHKAIEDESNGNSIIKQYNHNRKNNLKLYDGVLNTLHQLKEYGVKIIGFTESNVFFTNYRIKTLNMDGILVSIYSPKDTGLPESVNRYYKKGYWTTKDTQIKPLARDVKKPNPKILRKIISDIGGNIESTVYIGDKLDRDIYMANKANVMSVYAKYGHIITGEEYELLRDVTHWTDEEVEREKKFTQGIKEIEIKPNYTITNYNQILKLFNFMRFD